ncbi:hypothetical protein CCHR01_07955 [Colletotrichum chrysophilum]|uniref:Uncharacterized protein n=1 Tax=Colletotrichum chrysophilum TaxID=1836956 RepID=A0AAD9EM08_9PEZI|nr:hypothetical protein CCHR01_07955 [Colletotrichum chrysophilum]
MGRRYVVAEHGLPAAFSGSQTHRRAAQLFMVTDMDVKLAYANTAKPPLSRPGALQVTAISCPLSCDSNIIGAGDDEPKAFPKVEDKGRWDEGSSLRTDGQGKGKYGEWHGCIRVNHEASAVWLTAGAGRNNVVAKKSTKAAANLPDNAGNRARPGPKRRPETAVAGEGLMGADGEARGV